MKDDKIRSVLAELNLPCPVPVEIDSVPFFIGLNAPDGCGCPSLGRDTDSSCHGNVCLLVWRLGGPPSKLTPGVDSSCLRRVNDNMHYIIGTKLLRDDRLKMACFVAKCQRSGATGVAVFISLSPRH